jgi:thiamine biosynthesis protein ThiI
MPNAVLIRYGEIAIKGGNRHHFENVLKEAIFRQVGGRDHYHFDQTRGRLYLCRKDRNSFTNEQIGFLREVLLRVFGMTSFSFIYHIDREWETICAVIQEKLPAVLDELDPRGRGLSFRVRSRRGDKMYARSTHDMDKGTAEHILEAHPHLSVDLSASADLTIGIEVRKDKAAVYFQNIPGPGGLPVGTADSALTLLSAGIDSPVAAWQIMKRGSYVDYLTFHSAPYTPPETLEAVGTLVQRLNRWQRNGNLVACNLAEAQKVIRDSCSERFRTILYRRLMMRVASHVARFLGNKALITGESLGQVASQTLVNMSVIDDACDTLVLRPLVSYDKMEIVPIARRIDTLDISERGCMDSCTVFAPARPCTNAPLARILEEEANLDYDALLELALDNLHRIDPVTFRQFPLDINATHGEKEVAADA